MIDLATGFVVVCDGVGGQGFGEMAAEIAITTANYYVNASRDRTDCSWPFGYDVNLPVDENRLSSAAQLANRQVWRRAEVSPECAGMGTTFVAALVDGNKAAVANVGDSRCYHLKAGELIQVTEDDSWVNSMVQSGALTPEQARKHSMRNVLTQAIGSQGPLQVHTKTITLDPGDMLFLTSDGVHGVVDEAVLRSMLYAATNLDATANQIIERARSLGAPDNCSCILVRYHL